MSFLIAFLPDVVVRHVWSSLLLFPQPSGDSPLESGQGMRYCGWMKASKSQSPGVQIRVSRIVRMPAARMRPRLSGQAVRRARGGQARCRAFNGAPHGRGRRGVAGPRLACEIEAPASEPGWNLWIEILRGRGLHPPPQAEQGLRADGRKEARARARPSPRLRLTLPSLPSPPLPCHPPTLPPTLPPSQWNHTCPRPEEFVIVSMRRDREWYKTNLPAHVSLLV